MTTFKLWLGAALGVWVLTGGVGGPRPAGAASTEDLERRIDVLSRELDELKRTTRHTSGSEYGALTRTRVGGYMELHYLTTQGGDGENFDFHRYIIYLGHRFNDWIQFHSEVEFEHSLVKDNQGELELEQAYLDFRLKDEFGARAGVVVVPFGIINVTHEPPTFHGVERPRVDQLLIPTTWRAAGAGIYGSLTGNLKYQIYGHNALQYFHSSTFRGGTDGIRNLRANQFGDEGEVRDIAISARIDYAFANQPLNLGLSFYTGGADDKLGDTAGNPDITGWGVDARYQQNRLDFVGLWTTWDFDDANLIRTATGTNVSSKSEGWYAQLAYWMLQPGDRTGLLSNAGLAAFIRWEEFDTAKKLPGNHSLTAAQRGQLDRRDVVYGLTFKPIPNVAIKVDYSNRRDKDGSTTAANERDQFNAGIGWQF